MGYVIRRAISVVLLAGAVLLGTAVASAVTAGTGEGSTASWAAGDRSYTSGRF